MKINIMYIVSTLQSVGPTNQLLYLLKFIDKKIFDPIIVTLSPEQPDSCYKLFKEMGIRVESLNLSRIRWMLKTDIKINNLVNKYKPNIIQTLGFRADRIKIKHKIPRIVTLRTSPKQSKPFEIKPNFLGVSLANLLYKYHLSNIINSEFVVVCSKSLSEELYQLYNIKLRYIQNGVDAEKYVPVSEKIKMKIRNELLLPNDKKIFISLGSLIPKKNSGLVIELFKKWDFLNNSILIILGKGIEFSKYKKNTSNYENVKLIGHKQEVKKYLQASDYFISASKGEGLPNAVLEAMSTGIPCILSDIPPHREILDGSDLGVLFNNNNEKDFKEKILKIKNLDYNYLSKACRNHIVKNFSARSMSFNYQSLYRKILYNINRK